MHGDRDALATAFEATVLLSTGAGVAAFAARAWLARRPAPPSAREQMGARWRMGAHPLAQLVFMCVLLFVNQVLFGAYVLRAHGGSSHFVAQYISPGWFHIAKDGPLGSLVRWVAVHAGDARWLSPSVLRVQAFLELPFTLFAYLAVARMLGRATHRALCRLPVLLLASLSFSFTFSLVELSVPNPWTRDDLVLRALAAFTVPFYVAWIARIEGRRAPDPDEGAESRDGPHGVLGLLAFLAGAGAISYVVLAVFDAFLIYNLSHLPRYATGLALALVVAVLASVATARIDRLTARVSARSPSMDASVSALRAFTLLFFVPSLSLRYWGGHPTAFLAGVVVVVLALLTGAIGATARPGAARRVVTVVVSAVPAVLAGAAAAWLAVASAGRVPMPELLLARGALSFLAVAIVTFRVVEIAVCWALHETKAQADEA